MDRDGDSTWTAPDAAQGSPRNDSLLAYRAASELASEISHDSEPPLRCCCGVVDCALLKHNYSVLRDVERDVHMAADLGKALLARYEACMAEADRERDDFNARIQQLELDKQKLEAENASQAEENGSLLQQLEALNNSVSDSDTKIKSLEASLQSSQQAARRLEAAAARAADAERHILILEEEQASLRQELRCTHDKARTNAHRYKEAQRGILDLQDQLDSLEKEACQERQQHAETVERLERQREIDKKLDIAAGRLKGAAVTKSLKEQQSGTKIVGHFVRDLLTDNAKLQLNVVELRELLSSSNDEVQSLREQLSLHQPLEAGFDAQTTPTLKDELKNEYEVAEYGTRMSQELHIHHHYHLANRQDGKKHKKKRLSLPSDTTTPAASPCPRPMGLTPSPAGPVSVPHIMGFVTPTKPSPKWMAHSTTPSEVSWSAPASPNSFRRSAIFSDLDLMSSPTTSVDPASPTWRSSCGKRSSGASFRSFQSLSKSLLESVATTPLVNHTCADGTITEEDEGGHDETQEAPAPQVMVQDGECSPCSDKDMSGAKLRRPPSHESIVSIAGGMDIHTLKARPSQLALRLLGGSADAVVTGVTAQPTLLVPGTKMSQTALRDQVAGLQTPRSLSAAGSRQSSPGPRSDLSRSFGSWVAWRPWSHGGSSAASHDASEQNTPRRPEKNSTRAPGINQPGAIPGFHVRKGAPAKVAAASVDRAALQDGLQE
ncbi:hypothetical protein CDD81_3141 [Ophiocordyceps australis]|uniref:Uncharacterized protein n=1 Tax=Ophiocordyceps australis TaxID=1399860 RepID=A0A2C5XY04_9HYPO|nr:hypothetical protein CDD81_3141 [Ophiocordyceps australis]